MKKQPMHLTDYSFNKDWTLFLDRDGVINERLVGDYVKSPDELQFIDGVPEAIAHLSTIFGLIFIVTNQQGIGKGFMTEQDLQLIHGFMINEVNDAGGQIDGIYFSPHLDKENHPTRKPNTGMALQAQKDFPEIDFKKSVMIGDGLHDMEFGRRLGMLCVYISPDKKASEGRWDFRFESLPAFVKGLRLEA